MAGRLKQFVPYWMTLTNDNSILQAVSGLRLSFAEGKIPLQSRVPHQHLFNQGETVAIDTEIARLVDKGVLIESVPEAGQFINTIFTRPKKDGSHRMILNLKPLNKFIEYRKFKMDTLKTVLQLLHRGCFLASIDISDAYYTVPIHPDHQKLLKFVWKDKLFQYTALPNGYSDAPRVFTKLLKPVFAQLRRLGHVVIGYIDDIYIQADSEQACHLAVQDTVSILEKCGFLIHPTKSNFIPSQKAVYLGFELDAENMSVTLTEEKKLKYLQSCQFLMEQSVVTVRMLAKIIGQLVSTFPGVRHGPLYYRNMELAKIQALRLNEHNFDAMVHISDDIKVELAWWVAHLMGSSNAISSGKIDLELMTDATLKTWGAKCGSDTAGGFFSRAELIRTRGNINACELLAVHLSLQSFVHILRGKKVLVRSDNMVTIAYIAHMGGTKSPLCNAFAKEIWHFCIAHDIWLSAEHIAGILNVHADYESRHVDDRLEWALFPDVFDRLSARFGTPAIDLFASRLNAKLPQFVSWRPEPGALNVNAFTISWANTYMYMFPPFSLITKCVQKLLVEGGDALLIAPLWPTQPWFSQVMKMLLEVPVLLPRTRLLYLPAHPQRQHPLPHLRLIACRLSGDPTKQRTFQQKLSQLYAVPGEEARRNNTVLSFVNGRNLLIHDRLVTINPL